MPRESKKILVILDAHALIHRSYHALPSFTSPSGEPMGAVYGVSLVLLKLLRDLEPTHIAAAFDREEPTFRHQAYEGYKATRAETKSDLIPQFDKTKELFRAFGIPIFEVPGFEADDILGTLVQEFKDEKNLTIIIASGDMDTLQLVDNKHVMVYTLRKGLEDTILYDEEKVRERFGISPKRVTDFKGLKGDPSDNIIGVKGIGEKTATQLITHYGSIEELYKKLKKEKKHPVWLKERIKKLLLENEEEALFSKELATIRCDAPVSLKFDDLTYKGIPYEPVLAVFRKFHFPSLISRLSSQAPQPKVIDGEQAQEVDESVWKECSRDMKAAKTLYLYLENGTPCVGNEDFFYRIPTSIVDAHRDELQEIFLLPREHVTHDAKEFFHACGFSFPITFDIKIAAWICDPERRALSLDDLLESKVTASPQALAGLARTYRAMIDRNKAGVIYYQFELPLIPVLFVMEKEGILIDMKKLKDLEGTLSKELDILAKKIHKDAGIEFDIDSPKQLSKVLFEELKLPVKGIKKTSTKSISTQLSELTKLQGIHPVIDSLIQYREISKLFSTYVSPLPALAGKDGRIHTTFHQIGAATGRLSSVNPNLQNIPIRSERGKDVRRAFIADMGYTLFSFDYSQLELRIAAALSGDKKLTSAFQNKEDIHTRTAMEIFHIPKEKVTKDMRRSAKTINFGILYGMGSRALAQGMGITADEAEKYLEEYLKEFHSIDTYRKNIIEEGRKRGYVETYFGRRRYLPNLRSSFDFVRKEAERMAVNAPIQGTEADILKRAMIDITRELQTFFEQKDVRMLLQVHDELVFEIKNNAVETCASRIRAIMERVPELSVPIVVDVHHGANWQDMSVFAKA